MKTFREFIFEDIKDKLINKINTINLELTKASKESEINRLEHILLSLEKQLLSRI